MERLLKIMALLRHPAKGCPWDLEQTFKTIAPHTIEEAYEVADAIERKDMKLLVDELGDLLLQVAFHAQIAKELQFFDFDDVVGAICDKLVRRHPHVFAGANVDSAAAQLKAWEDAKAVERAAKGSAAASTTNAVANNGAEPPPHSVLDDVALGLPALLRALKLQKRAARVGFDWRDAAEVLAKVREEIEELEHEMAANAGASADRIEDETGDLLFAIVNLARKLGVDSEQALRRANTKFERRFRFIETTLAAKAKNISEVSLEEMEILWRQAKQREQYNIP